MLNINCALNVAQRRRSDHCKVTIKRPQRTAGKQFRAKTAPPQQLLIIAVVGRGTAALSRYGETGTEGRGRGGGQNWPGVHPESGPLIITGHWTGTAIDSAWLRPRLSVTALCFAHSYSNIAGRSCPYRPDSSARRTPPPPLLASPLRVSRMVKHTSSP